MLVLGLILILLAALVAVALVLGGANDPSTYSIGNVNVDMSVLTVFLLGAATLLVLLVGLALLRRGTATANQRRKDSKNLKKLTAKEREREAERQRLDDRAAAGDSTSATRTETTTTRTTDTEPAPRSTTSERPPGS
jgi:uncharacterized protein HemY